MFNNKSILITGGTGSFGKNFTKLLLKKYKPKKIIIFKLLVLNALYEKE